ncbi:MAG: hypothetical protein A3E78_00130 [Alphaproteobacteria bacterium RIFCSPHIGHO2_12_FULL_63_12]|nr:MAG: hypothetical protein A3E78_00130 [Alphaproteobacteria bacterium RIFCSPHIGHO2_12_FULL_63_12]
MPISNSSPTALNGKTVQELQAIAATASMAPPPRGKVALSRSARLHLIDQLSRWGGSGLALLAGASIFIAMVPARDMPIRASVWAVMIFASLYLCRRYRKEFRRGDKIASRPFRWRAYYVSTLAVVSAAFGAGAFLLLPDSVPPVAAMQTLALMTAAIVGAAAFHAAHRMSAVAAGLPAFVATAGAAAATFGASLFTFAVLAAGAAGAAFVIAVSIESEKRAAARFPRTAHARREIERAAYSDRAEAERAAS